MTALIDAFGTVENDLDRIADYESTLGYLHFLKHVVVNAQPQKLPFRVIGEDWQWQRENRTAAAIDSLVGLKSGYSGPLSFWHGYAKGHDKSHGIARKLCYMLGWSKRALHLYACAGDRDQAKLITLAMRDVLTDNPWIAERVKVSDYNATGDSGSVLEVMPMDAATGQGIFPDYLIAEEVTHWLYDAGRDFWNFILSSVNKRPSCVFEVCTNAGHIGSWQWEARKVAVASKFWSFYEQPSGPAIASWMNEEKIQEDAKLMDPGEVARLYRNRWIDPGEERGYLTLAEAERCVSHSLREEGKGQRGIEYYTVIDYGGVVDRCALGIIHSVPGGDQIVIDRLDCWQGSHENPVKIDKPSEEERSRGIYFRSVEEWLEITAKNFYVSTMVFDPYQMESLAQKFERKGFRVIRFEYRGGKSNYQMAQILKNYVQNGKLSWSPNAGLLPGVEDDTFAKELARLVKKVTAYGYRFDHESGRHDDRASCIGSGLAVLVPEILASGGGPKVATTDARIDTIRGMPMAHRNYAADRNLYGMGRD